MFDKFHIAQHLGEAVDKVRRREHDLLKAEGDERLTGTKYDWLRNPGSMDEQQRREFAELRRGQLKTARAWALKENGMALYEYVYEKPTRKHFDWWYKWAGAEPLAADQRGRCNAEASIRKHHHLFTTSDHKRGQRITQRQDSMGEVHGLEDSATNRISSTRFTSTAGV